MKAGFIGRGVVDNRGWGALYEEGIDIENNRKNKTERKIL